ncbi:MAG TPA: hypothetical protein VGH56_02740, partial [Solirubrobacteraceae bacterium]
MSDYERALGVLTRLPRSQARVRLKAAMRGHDDAELRRAIAVAEGQFKDYNPDEPRDERGRWTGGGDGNGSTAAAGGFPTTQAQFESMVQDPRNASQTMDGTAIQADTPLLVFHGTEREDATNFIQNGVDPADKPLSLGAQRYAAGEYAEFAPGAGLGQGLSVAGSPNEASGYGHYMLA